MSLLEQESANCYRIRRRGNMRVDAVVYLNKALKRSFGEEEALQQLADAAALPGVVEPVVGMPDIHTGFGLPIGGVMAVDAADGVVSAGAVGMDINCGVRLLRTNLEAKSLEKPLLRKLINAIVERVPTGVGKKSRQAALVRKNLQSYLVAGVPCLIEQGFGRPEDLECIEEGGAMNGADPAAVSPEAVARGAQLSTIGGGNHFIELGLVDRVFDAAAAAKLGLAEGQLTVMIHTGSRGFGHQICTDFTALMLKTAARLKLEIPTKGLAAVPIGSAEGRRYLAAMACAVNFAFCNRQWITHDVRQAFRAVLGGSDRDYDLGLVYDVAHNIAKFEEMGGKRLLIHRKGATRALPPGHPNNPPLYRDLGHPALIPGSMGTASHVIIAGPKVERTFYSVNHGAGRLLSRGAARREIAVEELRKSLGEIMVLGRNYREYLDEAPQAYKDIEAVIDTFTEIGFTRRVVRLQPLAVIKGQGKES
jgi:tRNA-splicing ligase RtcB